MHVLPTYDFWIVKQNIIALFTTVSIFSDFVFLFFSSQIVDLEWLKTNVYIVIGWSSK